MKKTQLREYRTKPVPELERELESNREKMGELRLLVATGKVKNLKEMHQVKRSIAQLGTLIRARKEEKEK